MPRDKDKESKRARRKDSGPSVAVLLMELADIHGRLLDTIKDPTVRAKWEAELEAQTDLVYQATKERH